MATLTIFRGLPASGKTTEARRRVDAAEPGALVRLNRDDHRRAMLAQGYGTPAHAAERAVSAARDAALAALLTAGVDVICDDTNLRAKYVRNLIAIARRAGAAVKVEDFLDVPVGECLRRDAARDARERVGDGVILDMHRRYVAPLRGGPMPIPEPPETPTPPVGPYSPRPGTARAVLVDLDGTVALLDRSPYDETLVATDRPNTPVIETVRALADSGAVVVFMSGRTDQCRADTEAWLHRHVVTDRMAWCGPHMRTAGDGRADHEVKLELFDRYVRGNFDVRVVLDDRDSVVALWRSMGLTCLQVAAGAF